MGEMGYIFFLEVHLFMYNTLGTLMGFAGMYIKKNAAFGCILIKNNFDSRKPIAVLCGLCQQWPCHCLWPRIDSWHSE